MYNSYLQISNATFLQILLSVVVVVVLLLPVFYPDAHSVKTPLSRPTETQSANVKSLPAARGASEM